MKDVVIGKREVGAGRPPFIIAEMSGNHNGSLDRAMAIVEAAAAAGADAIKLQTYRPDLLTLDIDSGEFFISDKKSLWYGQSLYWLYSQAMTPWEWHGPLFRRARELGLEAFSTPFGDDAVDFLETLDVPCYKIASFEIVHLGLIRKAARTGKPLIISTGMASLAEIEEAAAAAREAGCRDLILLKCTSTYPASAVNTNIRTIPHMRELFGVPVGLSDHTLGIGVAVASVALGAAAVEKHVTLSRADGGVDAAFSLEGAELKMLVDESRRAWDALGQVCYGPTEAERGSLVFRRSLYVGRNMKKGEKLCPASVRIVRPGLGLAPRFYDILLGRPVNRDVATGTAITWDLIG
jgi:pseudaminic acid synthase